MLRFFLKFLSKGNVLLFLMAFMPFFTLSAMTMGKDSLTVAAVQFEILPEMLLSFDTFQNEMEKAVNQVMAKGDIDLLIFPEYLGVFSSLIPWGETLNSGMSFSLVWKSICQGFSSGNAPSSIQELFLNCSKQNDTFLDKLWGELALKYNVYILGGSRFTSFASQKEFNLYNQAVVYAPDGKVCYRQNKFFLTEFEKQVLELSPGNIKDCEGFRIKDRLIRLTICRDTFLKAWEDIYQDGFLWIDIKANGTAYTREQKALFKRALPARLSRTRIPWGMTVCLTGHLMDLLWEGESSIIAKGEEGEILSLLTSSCSAGFEVLLWTFPF